MSRAHRIAVLQKIEQVYDGRALAYVTGDRQGLQTQVGLDQLPLLQRHLEAIGDVDHLILVVHTGGGDTNMPWPMINFVRAHAKKVTAVVPYKAHSAGTLLCLGADDISMTRYATLSPIDPTVANHFNPVDPFNPGTRMPIAVEDVLSYLELVNDEKWSESARSSAFGRLTEHVHPLALGNVQRSINQIRKLAGQMVRLGRPDINEADLGQLIQSLTTSFYTHVHLLNVREVQELGLPASKPSADQERALLDYYAALVTDLSLLEPFDAPAIARTAGGQPAPVDLERAYIETTSTSDSFVTSGQVGFQQMPAQPGQPPQPAMVAFEVLSESWKPSV